MLIMLFDLRTPRKRVDGLGSIDVVQITNERQNTMNQCKSNDR